jgi:hypothetical protein
LQAQRTAALGDAEDSAGRRGEVKRAGRGGMECGAVDPCLTRPNAGRGGAFSERPQPCPGVKLDLSFSTRQG